MVKVIIGWDGFGRFTLQWFRFYATISSAARLSLLLRKIRFDLERATRLELATFSLEG